jgi:putative spermidine/putrescine transport system substrate-binding protein
VENVQSFQDDLIALAKEKLAKGQMSRRQFNVAMGLLGLGAAGAGLPRDAAAQAKEIVFCTWGGTANIAYGTYLGKPFEQKNPGIKVTMEPGSPTIGRIRAMVDSKKVTWDIIDGSAFFAMTLGAAGYLEKIDYSVVKQDLLIPGMALEHGVGPYTYSNVMVYDASKFGKDPPKNWVDFFNFQKYPGKRMMRRDSNVQLEFLLMGDGVPADKLYPLDVPRALAFLKKHRAHLVFWNSGAESEQLIRSGEAVMGNLWNSRAKVLFDEGRGKFDFTWNQGSLQAGMMIVPKGNPAGNLVQRFMAQAVENENALLGLFGFFGLGPANKAAAARVSPDLKRFNPSDPDNVKVQVLYDANWWFKNYNDVNQKYLDTIAG